MNHINSVLRPLFNYASPVTLAVGSLITATALLAIGRIALAYKNSKFTATSDRIWSALYVGLMGSHGQAKMNAYKINKYPNQLGISARNFNTEIPEDGLTYKTSNGIVYRVDRELLHAPFYRTMQYSLIRVEKIQHSPPLLCSKKITLYNDDVLKIAQNLFGGVVVNLAHSSGRGGLLWTGKPPLQEESILRRSPLGNAPFDYRRNKYLRTCLNHYETKIPTPPLAKIDVTKTMTPEEYTVDFIPRDGVRYTPKLPIIYDENLNEVEPWFVNLISAAAPCMRKITQAQLDAWYTERPIEKVAYAIFYAAQEHFNRTVLMGAIGCGGFAPRKIDGKDVTTEQTKAYLGSVAEQILTAYKPFKDYLNLDFVIKTKNPKDDLIFTTFEKAINEFNLPSNT